MSDTNKKSIVNNFVWRLFERVGAQGVTFIVSIILARILEPEVYGTVAILTVFTSIMQVFVDSGMGSALIQKKDADDVDFSSVFYVNIVFCLVLYLLTFFISPFVANIYKDENICPMLRVLAITIIISGIKNVQQAYVTRNLLFKRFFFSTLGGTIVAAFVGIYMAFKGFGPWALVVQNIVNQAIDTLILWITVKWRPQLKFSIARVKLLFSYGWKLLLASLLGTIYLDLRQLFIGKVYTKSDLAFYNRGNQFPKLFITNINTALVSIMFPVMSREQDNPEKIKSLVKKSIQINAFVIFPLMMGLAVCGSSFIRLILTDKWLPCVPYLQIFCFEYALMMFNTSNQNSYQSTGRSDIYLRNEIITKIIGFVTMLATIWISVYALALSSAVSALIGAVIYAHSNKKLINYGFIAQLFDMLPNILLTIVMGMGVYLVSLIGLNDVVTLLLQIVVGIVVYCFGAKVIRLEAFNYVHSLITSYIPKRTSK